MKKQLAAAALVLAAAMAALPANAQEYVAEKIDNFTGEAVHQADAAGAGSVTLYTGCTYDTQADRYTYLASDGVSAFTTSVPNGAIVQGAVTLDISADLSPTLYRNGDVVTAESYEAITQPGAYSLFLQTDSQNTASDFSFTILGDMVGDTYQLTPPAGFGFNKATLNGEPTAFDYNNIMLTEEGSYDIDYYSTLLDKTYHLSFTVDHTPPALEFSGITDDIAHGPVTVSGYEDTDTIQVFIANTQAAFTNPLKNVGDYHIIATDEAGNSSDYYFTIRVYLNNAGIGLVALLVVLVAAAVIAMVYRRKTFRTN